LSRKTDLNRKKKDARECQPGHDDITLCNTR
jgi:hypothetical protein